MGVLAVLLALAGMVDAVSHAAEARRREIALRLAIGAQTRDIRSLLGRAALITAVAGQLTGVAAAVALAATARSYFFGVQAVNLVALATTVVGLLLAAGVANEVVVRRCARANLSLLLRSGD
jgi:putative ABC transport system permease protein